MDIEVLPAVTSLSFENCKNKIKEIDKLGLKRIALFASCLPKDKMEEVFKLLEETNLEEIPFVHLRTDMTTDEIDYLIKRWNTKAFNIHPLYEYPLYHDWTGYEDKIYIENTHAGWKEEELEGWAGICIDFSHLESYRLLDEKKYKECVHFIEKYKKGCAHISAIKEESWFDEEYNCNWYDYHELDKLSDLDYLKNYPKSYFPKYCAIELENSLEEQIEIKKYIEKIIKQK